MHANVIKACEFLQYQLPDHQRYPYEIPNVGRRNLAACFRALGFKAGAEIGVEQGMYSEVILQENPGLELHCVDAWQAYKGYREHVSQEKLDTFYGITQDRLAPYKNCRVIYHRGFSVPMSQAIPNKYLDFVYIDANHDLVNVINDLHAWIPKVRRGGIIAGHDYVGRTKSGFQKGYRVQVIEAVQAWTRANFIEPWFVLGSKSANPGEVRDHPRSWFWVKE